MATQVRPSRNRNPVWRASVSQNCSLREPMSIVSPLRKTVRSTGWPLTAASALGRALRTMPSAGLKSSWRCWSQTPSSSSCKSAAAERPIRTGKRRAVQQVPAFFPVRTLRSTTTASGAGHEWYRPDRQANRGLAFPKPLRSSLYTCDHLSALTSPSSYWQSQ